MSRLIDADALLEQYNLKDATKYGNKDDEQRAHSFSTMMLYEITDMIEDAPTAYDVDKVVEQLKKKLNLHIKDTWIAILIVRAFQGIDHNTMREKCALRL